MDTVLDEADWWFLENLQFEGAHLIVNVAEGITAAQPENFKVGGVEAISDCYPIEITGGSRHVRVEFTRVLAYQVTDESYAASEYGETQGGVLSRHTGSAYFKHMLDQSLIPDLVDDAVHHYSLSLADDILDVITTHVPRVTLLKTGSSAQ